ncbi:MAG: hypothetical protein M3N30_01840 [Bacteroidota bacterium]|nr:hypothetical protein [Bacteroidota bacterium]
MRNNSRSMFCLLLLLTQMHARADSAPLTVREKLINEFKATAALAKKTYWNETVDRSFVHFKEHEVVSETEYDVNGNFIATVKYYKSADMLPRRLALELRKKFPDKTIFGITEITTETETCYYIKLEDSKKWITVKGSSNGFMALVEKLNKQ